MFFLRNGEVTKNDCSAVCRTEAFHERFEYTKLQLLNPLDQHLVFKPTVMVRSIPNTTPKNKKKQTWSRRWTVNLVTAGEARRADLINGFNVHRCFTHIRQDGCVRVSRAGGQYYRTTGSRARNCQKYNSFQEFTFKIPYNLSKWFKILNPWPTLSFRKRSCFFSFFSY